MSCMYGFLRLVANLCNHTKPVRSSLVLVLISIFYFNKVCYASDYKYDINVIEKDGVYYINASSDISASSQYVRNVLTDYIHIYRLNDSIIESRIITPADDERVQVETLVQCCVPMFCKDVTRVEEVSETDHGHIQTIIVPEKSDFRSGKATWKIEPKGNITRLTYQANLEPDFFIPPIIGTSVVVKNMRKEFNTTFYRIERIAAINEAREWNNNYKFTDVSENKKTEPCAIISSVDF